MSDTKAMWDAVGSALIVLVRFLSLLILAPLPACFADCAAHFPVPASNTVLIPDRKSAIPAAVEMPAPVNAQKCLELRMSSANFLILSFSVCSSSKNSLQSALERAVDAIVRNA